jgi:uncharacterized protein (TIGR03086 family)
MDETPLERAWRSSRTVVANVTREQFGDSTPCQSWSVSDLLNHMIGVTYFYETGATTGTAALDDRDYTEGDFLASYEEGIRRAVSVIPECMAREVTLPFGTIPGAMWTGIVTTDAFIHGWDLATATGQPNDLDPELAAELLEGARLFLQPAFRGEDTVAPFGAEREAPPDATDAARLAAFLGRRV